MHESPVPASRARATWAALACCATVVAGTVGTVASSSSATTSDAPASSSSRSERPALSPFGFNANSYGTKVLVDGVEVRSLKDALINMPCTRRTGLSTSRDSLLSTSVLPEDVRDLVDLSLSRSTTTTYRSGARNGVRAVNTLGTISLGGTVGGVATPRVVIKGLSSVADSFHDAKAAQGKGRFGYRDSFTYDGLALELPDDNPVSSSLDSLLGALGLDSQNLPDVINVPVRVLIDTLSDLTGGALVIPGLGSISLGQSSGGASSDGSHAEAYALKISLANDQLGLTPTALQLGRASSVISRPVEAGVFRSKMTALEANLGGVLRLGGIGQRSLPCEGTGGKVQTRRVASAGIPQVLDLSGIRYRYRGQQEGRRATGFVETTIGRIDLATAGIVVSGLTSRVDLSSRKPNKRVGSRATTTVGSLLIGGKSVDVRKLAKGLAFTDTTGQRGFIQSNVLSAGSNGKKAFFGKQLTGLRVQLPGTNSTIDLGVANGEVFFR